ncbi:beta-lactamase family protein [Staphylococcus sp. ACRSN]|uniref:serine hydrolase domain-containing protein n=1 Tax=Staphylococcus sp. ACRSN TaxID=2918214 RepID=UPI001EF21BAB|nr:serine hydrolase domain-containing protein [Staphylococcus sp. ACRSN]MCG7338826.1 beta-lactamase family protein [Staphylococcus sp. ACRSN]
MTSKELIRILVLLTLIIAICILATYTTIQVFQQQNNSARERLNKMEEMPFKKAHMKMPTIVNDNPEIKEIDNYLKETNYNGTATILDNGKLKLNKGYGYKDFSKKELNTPDTMYLIGSVQKLTTGLIIKQLEQAKAIDTSKPITKYIPWFETELPITVEQLIFHKSGLVKYKPSTKYKDLKEAVQGIQKQGIDKNFHDIYRYNDANYLVLAQIIEQVTGKSFEQNFDQRIIEPFNLEHTAFYNNKELSSFMATGYKLQQDNEQPTAQQPKYLYHYYGAGNLYMTPLDMGKLIYSLQNNKLFSKKVTEPFIHESYTKKYPLPYRYGFYTFADKNRVNGKFFGHTFTVYFNNRYIIILGSNYEPFDFKNENSLEYIYKNILNQIGTYNEVGVSYSKSDN